MTAREFRRMLMYFVLTLGSSYSAEGAELLLKNSCSPAGTVVLLGDVAELPAGHQLGGQELATLRLFPAPSPGRTRWLRVRELQELLAIQGIDVAQLRIRGAARVEIRSPEAGTKASSANALAPQTSDADSSSGRQQVLVARRSLLPGDVISADDVQLAPYEVHLSNLEFAYSTQEVLGLQVLRSITANQPLDLRALQRPVLVRRNTPVNVVSRVGGVQVTTRGRALDSGARDDVISIQLLDDRNKRLTGRVTGLDEVEVLAQGVSLAPQPSPSAAVAPRRLPR